MRPSLAALFVGFLLVATSAYAQVLSSYEVDLMVEGDSAHVQIDYAFSRSVNKTFDVSLPKDAMGVEVYIDNSRIPLNVVEDSRKKRVSVSLSEESDSMRIIYSTRGVIDRLETDYVVADLQTPFDTGRFAARLALPEGASLARSIEEGGSVFPEPKTITTDGKRLIIVWEMADVQRGERVKLFAAYSSPKTQDLVLYVVIIAAVAVAGFVWIRFRKRGPPPKREVAEEVKEDELEGIVKHLKEEEAQVIRALAAKGGETTQGTLVAVTDIPKATMSKILKELEDRNLIYREAVGKKNYVYLKKR